jgi:hypothetical protein
VALKNFLHKLINNERANPVKAGDAKLKGLTLNYFSHDSQVAEIFRDYFNNF